MDHASLIACGSNRVDLNQGRNSRELMGVHLPGLAGDSDSRLSSDYL
jgi:hypothetical protein